MKPKMSMQEARARLAEMANPTPGPPKTRAEAIRDARAKLAEMFGYPAPEEPPPAPVTPPAPRPVFQMPARAVTEQDFASVRDLRAQLELQKLAAELDEMKAEIEASHARAAALRANPTGTGTTAAAPLAKE